MHLGSANSGCCQNSHVTWRKSTHAVKSAGLIIGAVLRSRYRFFCYPQNWRLQQDLESLDNQSLDETCISKDVFKIQPAEAADRPSWFLWELASSSAPQKQRRLQGLMSWWAFYEKAGARPHVAACYGGSLCQEYGKPVGRNTAYDKEWGLPAPPHMADGCSVM